MHQLIHSFLHTTGYPLSTDNRELFVFIFLPNAFCLLREKGFSQYAVNRALVWRELNAPETEAEYASFIDAFHEGWNSLNTKDKLLLQKHYDLESLRVTFWLKEPYVVLIGYVARTLDHYVKYICSKIGYTCVSGQAELVNALTTFIGAPPP